MINYDELTSDEIEQHFKEWFDEQLVKGMRNFSVSIGDDCDDPIQVKRQILKSEQQINNGDFEFIDDVEFDIDVLPNDITS